MRLIRRIQAPTPKFFKVLRTIGLVLATVGGVIVTAPISLPAIVTTTAGYLTVAGGVITAVSQLTTTDDDARSESG